MNDLKHYQRRKSLPPGAANADYQPMREELPVLARYLAEARIRLHFDYFVYGDVCSIASRLSTMAPDRLELLAAILGEDEIQNAIRAAEEWYQDKYGKETWDAFCRGDAAYSRKLQAEIRGEDSTPVTELKLPEPLA